MTFCQNLDTTFLKTIGCDDPSIGSTSAVLVDDIESKKTCHSLTKEVDDDHGNYVDLSYHDDKNLGDDGD